MMNSAYNKKSNNGMLHPLLDDKESYLETTATLLFGYSAKKGYDMGYLDEKFLYWYQDIINTMLDNFDEDGKILYCSDGTGPGSVEYYRNRPYSETLYSYGLAIMLFGEI